MSNHSTPHPYIYTIFAQKKYLFRITSIDKWYYFTYLFRTMHPFDFNCCKYTVSKIWINHKTRTFSWLFHCHKIDLLALFMHQNNRFPYPFIYFNLWNVYPFIFSYTWSPKKVHLLSLVLRAVGYFGSFITLCQLAMLDPHLEIRGALSPKKIFRPFGPQSGLKIRWSGGGGGWAGPTPGSAIG